MIQNLKIIWKLMLLAVITPLFVLILAGRADEKSITDVMDRYKSAQVIQYTASAQAMKEMAQNLQDVLG